VKDNATTPVLYSQEITQLTNGKVATSTRATVAVLMEALYTASKVGFHDLLSAKPMLCKANAQ